MKRKFSKLGKEFLEKLLQCETVDGLKTLFAELNLKMPEQKMEELFQNLQDSMKSLSEDELLNAVGGILPDDWWETHNYPYD